MFRLSRPRAALLAAVLSPFLLLAACSSDEAATPTPVPAGPTQVTEQITATSTDGVLFDIKLSGSVHDSDGDGSFRDEIEVLSPSSVEFQGHFPSPDGDLVIASCFAAECQTDDRSAEFSVRYWTLAN